MTQVLHISARDMIRSEGDPLPPDLPSSDVRYWVPRHKAAVVAAVSSGALSIDEACKRYMLSEEEFYSWKSTIDQYGVLGLRATPRERRRIPRQLVSEAATATLFAETSVDCLIIDVSEGGARLRFSQAISLPSTFELHCGNSGRSWWAILMWQNDQTAGVRFSNPLPPPWTIKSGLTDWLLGKRRTVVIDRIDRP